MSELERTYRNALHWYPHRWRAQHEDALLGILLDQAEEEGRDHMTTAERRNLTRRELSRRLSPILLVALLILGVLAALQIASMISFQQTFDTQLLFSPPPLHPVPIGTSWTPLFTLSFSAGTLYAICTAIVVLAAVGSALPIKRLRRA
jgi:hypothetical protein